MSRTVTDETFARSQWTGPTKEAWISLRLSPSICCTSFSVLLVRALLSSIYQPPPTKKKHCAQKELPKVRKRMNHSVETSALEISHRYLPETALTDQILLPSINVLLANTCLLYIYSSSSGSSSGHKGKNLPATCNAIVSIATTSTWICTVDFSGDKEFLIFSAEERSWEGVSSVRRKIFKTDGFVAANKAIFVGGGAFSGINCLRQP